MDTRAWRRQLTEIGRRADRHGWVPGGGGNFSVRLDDSAFLVTTSGTHKGRLTEDDFMRMDVQGQPLDEGKPSDEAGLHAAIYRRDVGARAVLHMHSPYALALAATTEPHAALQFSGQELIKVFDGYSTHATRMPVPVVDNDQDIPRLAGVADAALDDHPGAVAYIIRGHGLYTWAGDLERAERQVEALEFLCHCEWLQRTLRR